MSKARMEYSQVELGDEDNGTSRLKRIGTLLTVVGSALGFGSLWRFPEQVAHNGGSAFLLLYLVLGTIYAAPLLIVETIAGQLSGGSQFDGALMAGNKRYIFSGFAVFSSIGLISFYSTLLTYTAQYLIQSFNQPWYPEHEDFVFCGQYLSKAVCDPYPDDTTRGVICPSSEHCLCTWSLTDKGCIPNIFGYAQGYFDSVTIPNAGFATANPPDDWSGYILNVNWTLWAIFVVNIALSMSAVSFGDVVLRWVAYLTMLPSFALVIGLLIYNFTLKGAVDGLNFYVGGFVASDLVDTNIIRSTVGQVVFSCSLGSATIAALTSMNGKSDPVGTPSWIVVIGTCIFGMTSGLLVFSMLGYLSVETGVPIGGRNDGGLLGKGGTGLIFVTYSSGISQIAEGGLGSGFLHFFFWLMLYIMGFTTYVTFVKGALSTLASGPMVMNVFKKFGIHQPYATYVRNLVVFFVVIFFGLINCSDFGVYFVNGIDHFSSNLIMPMGTGTLALIYTWLMNEPWYQENYGKRLRKGQNMFFLLCLWACAVNNFIVTDKQARGWIWLTFAVIIPLVQPLIFAILLSKEKEIPYTVALEKSWNGAFGDTLDQISQLVNHGKQIKCKGGTFRNLAGLLRNMGCPLFLCLVVDTVSTRDFAFNYTPGAAGSVMPLWVSLACFFFPLSYFLCVIVSLVYPDWVIKNFSQEGTESTRGLLLKKGYAFGMLNEDDDDSNTNTHFTSSSDYEQEEPGKIKPILGSLAT